MNYKEKIVSDPNEQLILVDSDDNEIGYSSKSECHKDLGLLHRAFSIFLFNSTGELLIQKRSIKKELWGQYWSNSCCSHPRKGEDLHEAAIRRVHQELSIECSLNFLYKFQYQENYSDRGSEHELCSVFYGLYDGTINCNENEIEDWRMISSTQLNEEIGQPNILYTPWLKLEWAEITTKYKEVIENDIGIVI
jgi:isopentenyl-diphosphate delta-isomerase